MYQFRLLPTKKTLHWFDKCRCGDYRYQHEKGEGECRFSIHFYNGSKQNRLCLKFRAASLAYSLPSFHSQILTGS